MSSASDYGMLLTTAPSRDEAAKIAKLLLLVKTRTALFDKVIARIKQVHSYTVPEIVALPFSAGFAGYLSWIDEVTS